MIGYSVVGYSHLERGYREPSTEVVMKISEATQVSLKELMSGIEIEHIEPKNSIRANSMEAKLLPLFQSLSKEDQKMVFQFAKRLAE